jgi:hypothetical protein
VLYTKLRLHTASASHEEEMFTQSILSTRPMTADPSLGLLRVGNSTPYNALPSPKKHMDDTTSLDTAMSGLYINQVRRPIV